VVALVAENELATFGAPPEIGGKKLVILVDDGADG
jgi:hypothetical protein